MKCPICDNEDLQMTERQGVEIDYCPQCRGVWLDRGELDKIIEKSTASSAAPVQERNQRMPMNDQRSYNDDHHHDDHDSNQGYGYGKKRKKEGLLGDLFDF
jgi:Zn-finger nucleic acid-binding protein